LIIIVTNAGKPLFSFAKVKKSMLSKSYEYSIMHENGFIHLFLACLLQ
jgi:hypothetical protein